MTWRFIQRAEIYAWFIGLLYFGAFVVYPDVFHGRSHADDPMSVLGFGLLLGGIVVARWVQSSFLSRVEGLIASGAIHAPGLTQEGLQSWFHELAAICFRWILVPLFGLYCIGLAVTDSNELGKIHLYIGGAIGIWMVSTRFAFGVATGICAARLSRRETRIVLNPMHPDRSSGLGRLGYFYFDQALVLLLPAFFMLAWIVLVAVNLSSLERNEVANAVFKQIGVETQENTILSRSLASYVVCLDESGEIYTHDAADCSARDRSFLWGTQFYALTIFNIGIFMLSWGLPTMRLRRKMREYRESFIAHKIDELERVLVDLRLGFFQRLGAEPPHQVVGDMQARMDAVSTELGAYRATPTYPLPIWTALTAIVSNLSAVVGLIGASLL